MRSAARLAIATAAAGVATLAAITPGYAHKPITSPFTFADDVGPILREHCSGCHVSGGIAPMSLATYDDALPWAESMRVELVAGHMPPSGVESGTARFRDLKPLTAGELNVLLTWAAGGTPRGSAEATALNADTARRGWLLGEPDLQLQAAADVVIPAEVQERVEEFTLDTGVTETRWLRAVDVLPGDPTVVRDVTVSLAPGTDAPDGAERVLALWVAGEAPTPALGGTGFVLPAGARLAVRVHYKKTWQRERDVVRDRSTVGLYFATPRVAKDGSFTVRPVTIRVAALEPQPDDLRWPWTGTGPPAAPTGQIAPRPPPSSLDAIAFDRAVGSLLLTAYAVYINPGLYGATIRVDKVDRDGSRRELITLRPRSDSARRYWFRDPIPLSLGQRVEVRATREDPALLPPGAIRRSPADLTRLRVFLDVADALE